MINASLCTEMEIKEHFHFSFHYSSPPPLSLLIHVAPLQIQMLICLSAVSMATSLTEPGHRCLRRFLWSILLAEDLKAAKSVRIFQQMPFSLCFCFRMMNLLAFYASLKASSKGNVESESAVKILKAKPNSGCCRSIPRLSMGVKQQF